ncbi:MAG: dolichyl-phosphate beta-glucosyltransferase [Fimbriimonadaceae bacterium]
MSAPYLGVIVPAFNEEARIASSLTRIVDYYSAQPYSWHVTVISDGSTDRTEEIVATFAAAHSEITLLSYAPNRGKGFAVRKGMLEVSGDLLLFCDADLATPQEETEKLLAHLRDGADVAIGSRPLRESRLERRQPWYRELFGRMANGIVQVLAIRGIKDTQCGFKMFTLRAGREVFRRCTMTGFSFDLEALMIARDLGFRIDEVPIRWSHQEGSKVVLMRDGPRALRDLIILRLRSRRKRLREP